MKKNLLVKIVNIKTLTILNIIISFVAIYYVIAAINEGCFLKTPILKQLDYNKPLNLINLYYYLLDIYAFIFMTVTGLMLLMYFNNIDYILLMVLVLLYPHVSILINTKILFSNTSNNKNFSLLENPEIAKRIIAIMILLGFIFWIIGLNAVINIEPDFTPMGNML